MKKIIFLFLLVFLVNLVYAQDIGKIGLLLNKGSIKNENGSYSIKWEGNRDVNEYRVTLVEVIYKDGAPIPRNLILDKIINEDNILVEEKLLIPGHDYFVVVRVKDGGVEHVWFNMLFTADATLKAEVPRTKGMKPPVVKKELSKNKELENSKEKKALTDIDDVKVEVKDKDSFFVDYKINADMFRNKSSMYNKDLALMSIIACGTSYNVDAKTASEFYLKDFLLQAGFSDIKCYNTYNGENQTKSDKVLFAFGVRPINIDNVTYNLIAVIVRGTVAGEWFSNFDIGYEKNHKGFELATLDVLNELEVYLKGEGLDNNKDTNKIWITGHSRGAAVGNLLARSLQDKPYVSKDNIFGYLFATPNVTKDKDEEVSVFNFINNEDFVPLIPFWEEYTRFGGDVRTKEMSKDVLNNASNDFKSITGFKYYGFSDSEMKSILKELNKLAPNVDAFYNKKYNESAKDGGRSTYDVCNILGNIMVTSSPNGITKIPNDFNLLLGIMIKSNLTHPKMTYAHSIEYYLSLIEAYNLSF